MGFGFRGVLVQGLEYKPGPDPKHPCPCSDLYLNPELYITRQALKPQISRIGFRLGVFGPPQSFKRLKAQTLNPKPQNLNSNPELKFCNPKDLHV